jgi:peptidoglycan/xylan/chitin deacetylase (PgdA/CDA1 family)
MIIHFHKILINFFRYSQLHLVFIYLINKNKVRIINYHNPGYDIFSKHLDFFSRHFSIISMDDLSDYLHDSKLILPSRSLVITFDDGFKENYKLFNFINTKKIPVTIYAVSGLVDEPKKYWFKLRKFSIKEKKWLKSIDDSQRLSFLQNELDFNDNATFNESDSLSSYELQQFKEIGCSIGSHTITHPILTKCSGNKLRHEIKYCKTQLEKKLGFKVSHFAYPSGKYNNEVISITRNSGYETGRTIVPGYVTKKTNPFELPCMGISDDADLSKVILQVSGIWYLTKRLLKTEE